eukprot:CAMPEP_0167784234 /NCGR_PEP_ID=MMETSP0111_2-20121227/7523_1 /TAXON_ID=91324 /ORGANISM="Lotharella globosa, Strain CCCM811" /LENGTH=900 /DNA_ID=CAMNT_0007675281 /DNA_START=303 /DNA_END=3005 /DNA_ORIENTATION=-
MVLSQMPREENIRGKGGSSHCKNGGIQSKKTERSDTASKKGPREGTNETRASQEYEEALLDFLLKRNKRGPNKQQHWRRVQMSALRSQICHNGGLNVHLKWCPNRDQNYHDCKTCQKRFSSARNLNLHQATCTPTTESGGCIVCHETINEHIMLLCDSCDEPFHTYCLDPPLESLPATEEIWLCKKCVKDQTTYDKIDEALEEEAEGSLKMEEERERASASTSTLGKSKSERALHGGMDSKKDEKEGEKEEEVDEAIVDEESTSVWKKRTKKRERIDTAVCERVLEEIMSDENAKALRNMSEHLERGNLLEKARLYARPVDLAGVLSRLIAGQYQTNRQFSRDVDAVWAFWKLKTNSSDEVVDQVAFLKRRFRTLWRRSLDAARKQRKRRADAERETRDEHPSSGRKGERVNDDHDSMSDSSRSTRGPSKKRYKSKRSSPDAGSMCAKPFLKIRIKTRKRSHARDESGNPLKQPRIEALGSRSSGPDTKEGELACWNPIVVDDGERWWNKHDGWLNSVDNESAIYREHSEHDPLLMVSAKIPRRIEYHPMMKGVPWWSDLGEARLALGNELEEELPEAQGTRRCAPTSEPSPLDTWKQWKMRLSHMMIQPLPTCIAGQKVEAKVPWGTQNFVCVSKTLPGNVKVNVLQCDGEVVVPYHAVALFTAHSKNYVKETTPKTQSDSSILEEHMSHEMWGSDDNKDWKLNWNGAQRDATCTICYKRARRYCSLCRSVYYCSIKCQWTHWRFHNQQCKDLVEARRAQPALSPTTAFHMHKPQQTFPPCSHVAVARHPHMSANTLNVVDPYPIPSDTCDTERDAHRQRYTGLVQMMTMAPPRRQISAAETQWAYMSERMGVPVGRRLGSTLRPELNPNDPRPHRHYAVHASERRKLVPMAVPVRMQQ